MWSYFLQRSPFLIQEQLFFFTPWRISLPEHRRSRISCTNFTIKRRFSLPPKRQSEIGWWISLFQVTTVRVHHSGRFFFFFHLNEKIYTGRGQIIKLAVSCLKSFHLKWYQEAAVLYFMWIDTCWFSFQRECLWSLLFLLLFVSRASSGLYMFFDVQLLAHAWCIILK